MPLCLRRFRRLLAVGGLATGVALAAESASKVFDLPADVAENSLKRFSVQSGVQVVFGSDVAAGVRTNAVKGVFLPLEAADRLVRGTPLSIVADEKTGVLTVRRLPKEEPEKNGPRAVPVEERRPANQSTIPADETVVLSPFEVVSETRGYHAANTMLGTRLNSKLEDLGASISVITKEQMQDFALLDINDLFSYEAGTEGTGNYTSLSFDTNGTPVDDIQLNPQGANRVRGIGPANTTIGNFETSGRVPIDPVSVEAVEISRGPNSSIFGIGSAAGSVNTVPASANLSRDASQVTARTDDRNGFRSSLDLNRVLKRNVLAARASTVFQRDRFSLKPAGTESFRLNGMLKYRPFRATTISGSYTYYHIRGNRANSTPPRDGITGWKQAGSPTWDPVTATLYVNGTAAGRFTTATPAQFHTDPRTFSQIYVDQGGLSYWTAARTTTATNPNTPYPTAPLRYMWARADPSGFLAAQPLYQDFPALTGKEVYDWTKWNLGAPNHINDRTETMNVLAEHFFIQSARQTLGLQLGWFREMAERYQSTPVGRPPSNPSSTPILQIDINQRLLDGSPNPYYLRPFIGVTVPGQLNQPLDRDTYRAQLAYALDLRRERGWRRWLGLQQVSGYVEYKDYRSRTVEYSDAIVDAHAWLPSGIVRGANTAKGGLAAGSAVAQGYFRYYLGDNVGMNIDYAPFSFSYGKYPLVWGDGLTAPLNHELAELGRAVFSVRRDRSVLKSRGVILQSHLLNGKLVTTFGTRFDERYSRGITSFKYLPNGIDLDYTEFDNYNLGAWSIGKGPTRTAGAVAKPLPWLNFFVNKSDSFQPAGLNYNLRLQPLPDPSGQGEDYGFALSLWQGRVVLRAGHYRTLQAQSRNGVSGNIARRLISIDYAAARSLQTKATEWVNAAAAAQGVTLSATEANQRVAGIMKVPVATLAYDASTYQISAADDVLAKGTEVEVNFNPNAFFMAKLNVTQQEAINSSISDDVTTWIAERTPVWQGIIDPIINRPWFTERYDNVQSASENLQANVAAPIAIAQALAGKSRPQIRKYRANALANYRLAGITDQHLLKRFNVGGALRWEDKGAIGYYGLQQPPEIVTALDRTRPIYDKAHLYIDLLLGYRTRLFGDKVRTTFQFNVRNVTEGGRLQPVSADPDGKPTAYRIVEPRLYILSATFDL